MPGSERVSRPSARGSSAARVVLTTAPDRKTATALARALVDARAAACASLVPGVRSVYRWQGRVEESREVLLVIKTTQGRLRDLERLLADRHPYDVPEVVVLAPARVERKYLAWLRAETSRQSGRGR